MEKIKMTEKQNFIGKALVEYYKNNNKGLNVYEFINIYKKDLQEKNIDTQKINSVNATLASLASKELTTKTKIAYNDKMVTCYTPTELLINCYNEDNNTEEEEEN